jgi:hypothetical protein
VRTNAAISLLAHIAIIAQDLKNIRILVSYNPIVKINAVPMFLFPKMLPVVVDVIEC